MRFVLQEGSYKASPEAEKTFGKELLDQVNHTTYTARYAKGGYVAPKPAIGRIVRYKQPEPYIGDHAAIITKVGESEGDLLVSLCVFEDNGTRYVHKVGYSVSTPGCWSWPPR